MLIKRRKRSILFSKGIFGNILWFIFGGFLSGLELAIANALLGLILCATIVGIPFGLQYFKIAKLALAPFGSVVD